MRVLKRLIGGVLVLALLVGGVFAWRALQVSNERAARGAAVQAELMRARASASLSPEAACILAEAHYLEKERALATRCHDVTLEPTRPGVLRFRGLRYSWGWDEALLGTSRVPTLCLAKGPRGWSVAGEAYRLSECQFDAPTSDTPGQSPEDQMAKARRVPMDEAFAAIREALTRPAPSAEVCEGLPELNPHGVLVLDADLLGADRSRHESHRTKFGDILIFSCFPQPGQKPPAPCEAYAPITHAVIFDAVEEEEPREMGGGRYEGGHYAATVKLVDVKKREVACQRAVSFQLPAEFLTLKSRGLLLEYGEKVREALRQSVSTLTGGKLTRGL